MLRAGSRSVSTTSLKPPSFPESAAPSYRVTTSTRVAPSCGEISPLLNTAS